MAAIFHVIHLSDIFDIDDHFTGVFIRHAHEQLSAAQDHPFSTSASAGLGKAVLRRTSPSNHVLYYLNGPSLVVLWLMWDRQSYPVISMRTLSLSSRRPRRCLAGSFTLLRRER